MTHNTRVAATKKAEELVLDHLKEVCAEGLVLTGGGKEGIFIKEVKPDSPASKHLSMKEGDQILSATVYFDNVSCEDALQILDHAHPYKMEFCLRRKVESTMPEDAEIIHPEVSYGIRIRGPLADMATTKPHFSSTVDGFQFLLPESSGNKQESTIIDIQESSFAIPDISQAKFKTDSAISAVEMKDLEIRTSKLPTETNIDHLLADVDRRLESKFKLPNVDLSKLEAEIPIHEKSIMGKGLPEKKGPQSVNMDEKIQNIEIGGQGSKFKLPKFEISFPEVKVPKMHFSPSKKDTEFAIAEGNIDMPAAYSPDVEIPDAKTKIKEDTREVDSKVMNAEITLSIGDTSQENETKFGSPTKFKLPSISFPKFGAKAPKAAEDISDIDAQSKGPEISLSQAEVTVSDEPLSDIQTEGQESKFKLPKFEISLPDVGGLKTDLSAGKTETDISAPEGKREVHASDVEVPDLKTKMKSNISKVDSKGQEAEIKKPVFSFPRFGFSKSETKSPETDLSPAQVDVSLPGENVKLQGTTTDITFSMVDTEEEDKMNFGSPTKFKLPSISLPKFAAKATKDTVDISAVDDQIKENEIKGPELKVSVEPLSVHIKGPETDTNEKSVNIEMKAQDIQNEGQKSKFKLPKFGTSFPELKGPKIDLHVEKTDTDISLSVGKGDIHVHNVQVSDVKTEVLVDLPDSKGHEVKMDKPGFSFPKFGFSKSETKAPEGDVSLPQVGVSLPGEHVKMEEPNTEITLFMGDTVQEDETKFDSPKFKFPSISFPKFGAKSPKKAIDISTVDVQRKDLEISLPQREVVVSSEPLSVDTKPPGVDNEEKSLIVKIKAEDMKTEGQERKFKLPKSGIKMKKPGFSLPKMGYSKSEKKESETDFKLPTISLPKFGSKVGVPVDPIAVEIKEPDKDNQGKSLSVDMKAQDVQIEGEESKFKLPKFGISFPEVKGPKIDLHGRKTETDISLPEGKGEIHGSYAEASDVNTKVKTDLIEVDLKIKVDLPKVDSKGLKVEMKKPGFSLPRIGFSKSETKESETDANINVAMGDTREQDKMKVVGEPKFKLTSISLQKFGSKDTKEAVDSSVVDGQIRGPEISLPITEVKVSAECVSPDVKVPETKKDEKSVNTEMKGQDIPIEGHESMFKLPKFGISLPELKGPKMHLHAEKIDTDVSLPEGKREVHAANVQVPDVKTEVQVDLPKVDSKGLEVKMDKLGFSFPRFGFSKSETKAPEGDVSLPQVDVSLPVENVRMEEPHTEIKLSMGDTGQEIETKFGSPKFKLPSISLPKFGAKTTKKGTDISAVDVQMKGPEISLPQTEALVSSQPLSLDIKAPEVDKEEKSLNVDIKDEDIKTEWQESKFKLPKFGISLPEVKGPKTDLRAVKTEIDIVLLEGKGEVFGSPKFYLPSISLPKFGGKSSKPTQDCSAVDGQSKGPEISLTEGGIKGV
uniref:PDZ domain-containing protein n=1 Tax=Electrophorus electricus TaxID=8005 RepID=A0A4W4EDE7_ELEEL